MQFHIENMTCGGCVRSVTKAIQSVDPGAEVTADPATHKVDVRLCDARHSAQRTFHARYA